MRSARRSWMGWVLAGVLASGCYRSHTLVADAAADGGLPDVATGSGPWLAYGVGELHEEAHAVLATQLDSLRTVTIEETIGFSHGVWSPVGRMLAVRVTRASSGETGLLLARFDDTGIVERRWWHAAPAALVNDLTWSPDGRYLASTLGRERALRIHDVDAWEDPLVVVTRGVRPSIAWSPSGHALAVPVQEDDELVLYIARAAEGFVPRPVILPPDVDDPWFDVDEGPSAWSPDGRWLAFQARDVLGRPFGFQRLFVTSERDLGAVLVSPALSTVHPLAGAARWAPDSSRLLYADTSPSPETPLEREQYVIELSEGVPGAPVRVGAAATTLEWVSGARLISIESARGETRGAMLDVSSGVLETTELFSRSTSSLEIALHADPLRGVLPLRSGRLWTVAVWDASRTAPIDVVSLEHVWLDRRGWSPEGDRFAFVGHDASGFVLFEVRFPSGELERIHDGVSRWTRSSPDWTRPWSAGGEAYFFRLRDDGLAIRDVRDAETHVVVEGAHHVGVIGWEQVRTR